VIDNRSGGPIRGLTLKFPQPVHGCSANCQWEAAFDYYTLADIPPCSMETTTTFRDFSSPAIGPAALNGSILDVTDQNGKSWALIGGVGKLIELTGYKQSAGVSWVAASRSSRLKTAPDDGAELVRSPAGHRVGGPARPSPLAGRESGCAVRCSDLIGT
jgi:hypothetical protein